jgi:hypothetical protein
MGIGIIVSSCCTTSRVKYNLGLQVVFSRLTRKRRRGTYISTDFLWPLSPVLKDSRRVIGHI